MTLVDTHCHLGHLKEGPEAGIAEAIEAGVGIVIDIGMGIAESEVTVRRAGEHQGVFAAVGIHPNDLADFEADPSLARLRELASSAGVVAIGETGIDTYRDRWPADVQEASFRRHIAIARETDKTLVIHCRDAHEHVARVLSDGAPDRVVMHCFSGDAAFARLCADRGWYCSFAGNLTYPKNDELREIAAGVPEHLLLVETDAPYLTPQPVRKHSNRPAFVVHTAEALAGVRRADSAGLAEVLLENARTAFAMP